ncbi:MAG: signal peptidase I [Phycisphaerae bacterium]|nr:signal peptidase I [Phycisphaerae bacterium]
MSATASQGSHIKETLISIIIAFVLAFVFRAFVIEAFIIPTGSMAPTLMGAHMRITSPQTGRVWPVGPHYFIDNEDPSRAAPEPIQGARPGYPVHVTDPMTGEHLERTNVPTRAGDRILVFKYLYSVYDPRRFDVVVFKAPHDPQTNYIKRLVGLPGEMVALIDGDVFVRRALAGEPATDDPWSMPGWTIQRKPDRVQRTVWQLVFSSEYQPLNPDLRDRNNERFKSPWTGGSGWAIEGRRDYEYAGPGPTSLEWDAKGWPVTDYYPYDETGRSRQTTVFPVSDVSMRAGVMPSAAGLEVSAVLRARGFEFRGEIRGDRATLKMGEVGEDGSAPAAWTEVASGMLPRALPPGRVTNVSFWHADQSLSLWVDEELVARGTYDWTPGQRVRRATGLTLEDVLSRTKAARGLNPLADTTIYRRPGLRWEFSGPVRLYRVGLQRDVHYQAANMPPPDAAPARATNPLSTMTLGRDHFFVCGDNSPASLDARLWGQPDPWVAREVDATPGIVPRDLMIGRAFFVYFPSMQRGVWPGLPMPDFGRLRWIW